MKNIFTLLTVLFFVFIVLNEANAKTKCISITKSKDGTTTQQIDISISLVKLLASSEGNLDINGVKVPYKSLLQVYRDGSVIKMKDSTGNGEMRICRNSFDQEMKESSDKHNRIFIENTEEDGETKVSKIHVKSIQAIIVILAMLGSDDIDEDIDDFESALDEGGVLFVRDYEKNSRLWIYVN